MAKRVSLYSAQKYHETGRGTVTRYIPAGEPAEMEATEARLRKEMAEANARFKGEAAVALPLETAPPIIASEPPTHSHTLELRLDPGTGNSIVLLGSSKRGKTTAMMWMYDRYFRAPQWISTLFSVSSQADIYQGRPELIQCGGFNAQGERFIYLEKMINTKGAEPNKYDFLNMFDDVIDAKHSRLLNSLLLTYRNSNMSSVISLQYSFLLSKMARANVNNVLLFGFNSDEAIEDVIRLYLRGYMAKMGLRSKGAQIEWYKKATENSGFFYLHPLSGEISLHRLVL
jgi:hypothetical protein